MIKRELSVTMTSLKARNGMWSDHMRIEERSIALHAEIAERLAASPELLETARRNIARWIERDGEIPPWKEWREILGRPLPEIIHVLVSPDENARRLRQSSPFCGLLTPRERWRIYESFTVGAYYQGRRQHSR
ncbi:MAG: hypothetical protein PHS17_11495 [Desulfobacterales bacterium]|nr:hypothetical protein [Desulfobacterales bacterium]